jgi:hypothetical protein
MDHLKLARTSFSFKLPLGKLTITQVFIYTTKLVVFFTTSVGFFPRLWYPYFVVVARLAWSNDPESYAGGSLATGRASQAGQVEGDDPD